MSPRSDTRTTAIPPIRILALLLTVTFALLLGTVAWVGLRPMPPHMAGLDAVLTHELERDIRDIPDYRCTLGAHRGDSLMYIENTINALRAARDNPRYAFIECDVQYAGDDTIVCFHDQRLSRVFGFRVKIDKSTTEELLKMSGGGMATYDDLMRTTRGKQLNIEIKSQGDDAQDRRLVDFIVADLRTRRAHKRVALSSISEEVVAYIKASYPDIAVGQIYWITASTYLHLDILTQRLYQSPADYLMLHVANLRNIKDLLRLKPEGKTIVFWDFDDTMVVVHKDLSDRMWGDTLLATAIDQLHYRLRRFLSSDNGLANL